MLEKDTLTPQPPLPENLDLWNQRGYIILQKSLVIEQWVKQVRFPVIQELVECMKGVRLRRGDVVLRQPLYCHPRGIGGRNN